MMRAASITTLTPSYGVDYFQNVTSTTDLNMIDSYPIRICQCILDKPRCDIRQHAIVRAMKGEEFNVTIVAVNQVNKTINSSLFSYTLSNEGHLAKAQYLKYISDECTTLTFNVYSPFSQSDSLVIMHKAHAGSWGYHQQYLRLSLRSAHAQ